MSYYTGGYNNSPITLEQRQPVLFGEGWVYGAKLNFFDDDHKEHRLEFAISFHDHRLFIQEANDPSEGEWDNENAWVYREAAARILGALQGLPLSDNKTDGDAEDMPY